MSNIQNNANNATLTNEQKAVKYRENFAQLSPSLNDALATGKNSVVSVTFDETAGHFVAELASPLKLSGQGVNKPLVTSIHKELAEKFYVVDKDRTSKVSLYLRKVDKVTGATSRGATSEDMATRMAYVAYGLAGYVQGKGLTLPPMGGNVRRNGSDFVKVNGGEAINWTGWRFGLSDGIRLGKNTEADKIELDLQESLETLQDSLLAIATNDQLAELVKQIGTIQATRKKEAEAAKQTAK